MQTMEDIEHLFLFLNLKLVTHETNTFFVRKVFLLPVFLPTIILQKDDNDFLLSVISDNDTSSLRQSIKIYHISNIYWVLAIY